MRRIAVPALMSLLRSAIERLIGPSSSGLAAIVATLVLANTIEFIVGFVAVLAPSDLGVRGATKVAILAPLFHYEKF